MKAYLIDPAKQEITEVEHNGDHRHIYTLIDAECFDVARINERGDAIFVDDEGLLHDRPTFFFRYRDYPNPLAGKGLVLGCDAEGETTAPHVTLERVRDHVTFVRPVRVNGELYWAPAPRP